VANNTDLCPADPNKQTPGACGCGVADVPTTWYLDSDGDGFGDPNASQSGFTCIQPTGYVANNTDLCPADPNKQNPGACGCGVADVPTTWYLDSDGDGFGDPNASQSGFTCIQPTGYVANNTDLCPADPNKQNPGACGCGVADVPTIWYLDSDGDGFGDPNASQSGFTCIQPTGYVANNTDCNDGNAAVNPGATEVCGNNIDDNCDGQIDEGCCDLLLTGTSFTPPACPGGSTGSITISATTSSGPITYAISGPVNQSNQSGLFSGLPAGNYNITITDAANCIETGAVAVAAGVDNTPPTVQCFNQTITFNGETAIPLLVDDLVNADDNCGLATIALSPTGISCEQVGQTVPVTVTVMDINGNPATCTSNITVAGLPCGWRQNPDGVGCTDGNNIAYNPATGVWTATSTNCFYGPGFTSDATAFAQRTLCGDGSITAEVTGISGTALGWAGVVMRESNAAGAKKAQLMTNLSSFSRREFRTTTGGAAIPQQFPSQDRYWLRLVRAGNQFSMYVSANGLAWYFVGAQNVPMNSCIQVGLVATNYQQSSTVTATFANVAFTGSNVPVLDGGGEAASFELRAASFEVYPNPTSGELNVDLAQYAGRAVRLEMYSLTGQLLRFTEIDEVQTTLEQLDLSGFTGGMYLIRVKSEGLPDATRRIVVTR
jgi:regulation of enolase protein 1 (concanavalin A-like superfamily)